MEYKIITVASQQRLEAAVRLAISDGWTPIGSAHFAVKNGEDVWIQSMSRAPKENSQLM